MARIVRSLIRAASNRPPLRSGLGGIGGDSDNELDSFTEKEIVELFSSLAKQNFSYQDLIGEDRWESWTPVRTSWTDVGTPTVTARFHVIGKQCFIQIQVVPSTTTATTAGTSYVSLPIAAEGLAGEGSMVDATTNIAVGTCVIDVANSRIYVPTQAATGDSLLISAWYEIQ